MADSFPVQNSRREGLVLMGKAEERRGFVMVVIYFSGTGNSEYISRQFAERMGAKCHSIEEDVDFERLLSEADILAVCYPIYGSLVPRIMREFAEKYKNMIKEKELIIFCTQMMFSGDGARAFARLIPGCEKNVIYAEHFCMPNNICNFFLFPIRERERSRKKRAADRKLEKVCRDIRRGISKKRGWSSFSAFLGRMQNTSFPGIEEKGRSSFAADRDCTGCGLCVKRCPMQNLEFVGGRVRQRDNCTLCYRCVNLCPRKAAVVLFHKKPKRQYRGM